MPAARSFCRFFSKIWGVSGISTAEFKAVFSWLGIELPVKFAGVRQILQGGLIKGVQKQQSCCTIYPAFIGVKGVGIQPAGCLGSATAG